MQNGSPQGGGLVLVSFEGEKPKILMVRSASGWEYPTLPGVTGAEQIAEALRERLHLELPTLPLGALHVDTVDNNSAWRFYLGVASGCQCYLNGVTPNWTDARWTSLDEAFHIVKGTQDPVRIWAERHLRKLRSSRAVESAGPPV